MRKVLVSVAALAVCAAPAFAADMVAKAAKKAEPAPMVSPWDIAFGGVISTDYNFRGVSQSNKGPSGGAYFEPQFNTSIGQFYAGLAVYSIEWPSGGGYGFTDPAAEVDFYGGWRNSWGPVFLDLGAIYYYYPKEMFNGATDNSDFWEAYAKASYAVTPALTFGGNVFYTPDLLNYSETFTAAGVSADASAVYASATAKWILPWTAGDLGSFVSGELGHWWIDDGGFVATGFTDPSYTYYNLGLALTYKAVTLDLRYHGTDQDTADCNSFLLVAAGNPSSDWCDGTFVASLKFDTALSALK
ncbi:MAG: TorF family putative porin [Xanthobacteraceae bacterium]